MSTSATPDGRGDGIQMDAVASDSATIFQAGNDQHLHFGDGSRKVMPAAAGLDAVCPYPGLAPFSVNEAQWFFGRERLTADLLAQVDASMTQGGPVMVVAASGAGKSSLLRAGFLQGVAEGRLTPEGSRHWPRVLFAPGVHPMREAINALRAAMPIGQPASDMPPDPGPDDIDSLLRDVAESASRPGTRVVVVVDQFEELFTLCESEAERTAFISWLCRAASSTPAMTQLAVTVCGLRADFYAECARYPELRHALQALQVLVGPMSEGELRQAIRNPAIAAGLDLDPGLIELLLADLRADNNPHAGPGSRDAALGYDAGRLPLLAYALRTTWQERHGSTLTVDGYRQTGGIEHAIAVSAERVFDRLDATGKQVARPLLLRLVKVGPASAGDVRRAAARPELTNGLDAAAAPAVVRAFTDSRLLTAGIDAIQMTHEALLRAWPRLQAWLDDDRASNPLRQHIEDAAAEWQRSPGDPSQLYRGPRLQGASTWARDHGHHLSDTGRRFLTASARLDRRIRLAERSAIATLIVLAVTASTLAVAAAHEASIARHEAGIARHEAGIAIRQRNLAVSQDATEIVKLLTASSASRRKLLLAIPFASCVHGNPVPALRQVIAERRTELIEASIVPYSALPDGHAIQEALANTLSDSLKADKSLLALARLDQRAGCRTAKQSSAVTAANNADNQATNSKIAFTDLWNRIAAQYGYPSVNPDNF
jgi:hypothetical protein